MREQNDLAAFVRDFGDGGRDTLEPCGAGYATLLHGPIEIDAQQHAPALYVDVLEGAECFCHLGFLSRALRNAKRCAAEPGPMFVLIPACMGPGSAAQRKDAAPRPGHETYSSLPIATAVSAMRFEKPHSLSYQAITRTSVPFCTLV